MNMSQAFDILEIDLRTITLTNLTHEYIKKKYHKLALINHPDKNGNTEKFQQINDRRILLKSELIQKQNESDLDLLLLIDLHW